MLKICYHCLKSRLVSETHSYSLPTGAEMKLVTMGVCEEVDHRSVLESLVRVFTAPK